jgi:multidrug efflux pump subunit AcrA (membrane-fusion protein)
MKLLVFLACAITPVETETGLSKGESESPLFATSALVTAIDHVDVPSRQPGVLAKLSLRRGTAVRAGDSVAMLDDRKPSLNYEIAKQETLIAEQQVKNRFPTLLKQTIATYATKKFEMNDSLYRNSRGAVSQLQLQTSKSEMEQATIDANNALAEEKQLAINYQSQIQKEKLASLELQQCLIKAPLDGIVSQIHRRPGEWVNTGESILTLVRMDRLRIETLIHPAELTPQQIISCRARVTIQLSEEDEYLVPESRIYIAGAEIEADGRYLVAVEIENEFIEDKLGQKSWLVRPGMTCRLDVLKPLEPAAPLQRPDLSFSPN